MGRTFGKLCQQIMSLFFSEQQTLLRVCKFGANTFNMRELTTVDRKKNTQQSDILKEQRRIDERLCIE